MVVACGGGKTASAPIAPAVPAEKTPRRASVDSPLVSPARVLPPTERSDLLALSYDSDGSRRFVSQGLRMVERPDGSLEAATEYLPATRGITAARIPDRLGGGFVFVVNTSGSALLYTATTWTSTLRPVSRFDGDAERLVAGFDRIYVLRGRSATWAAIDPKTGRELDLGSLPPAAGYGAMAFADEWLAAVELPFVGVVATFDAGATWHPLGIDHATLSPVDGAVLLELGGFRALLGPSGELEGLPPPANDDRAGSDRNKRLPPAGLGRALGPHPLETAVLHGMPEPGGTALVAASGSLFRVRLADGKVLAETRDAYAGVSACDAVPLGRGVGFVCGEPGSTTRVLALEPPLALRAVASFAGPRRVAPNGRGGLVVSGGCEGDTRAAPAYCVLPAQGDAFEVARGSATERVVALADGRLAVLEPSRPGFAGTLTFVGPGSRSPAVGLAPVKPREQAVRALASHGFWLDAFQQGPDGKLIGFIAGAASFVGVRVSLDGKVELGEPEQALGRAFFSGRYAFAIGRGGGARETVDGGFEWSDAELPSEPDLKLERTFGTSSGCTSIGCAFAGWLRVGWGDAERLPTVAAPEPTRFTSPGGGRWSLECRADGRQSPRALRVRPENEERTTSPWNPLAEVAAPARAGADLGFDVGSEAELHLYRAYVWGAPGDGWARQARFAVSVRDPYRIEGGVWSTAPSPVPWARPEQAADVFGRSPTGPPSTFRMLTDPVRHVALLIVTLRGSMDLFLLEEGRSIVRLATSGALGVITGFATAKSRVYLGALAENHAFRVYRVEAGGLALIRELPDVTARAQAPILAPSLHGEALGLWVHAGHHYLYPLDASTGLVDEPIVVGADTLSRMPEGCSSGEDGYVVGDALTLEPSFDLSGERTRVGNGSEVRLVVSRGRVCTDAIAAPIGPPRELDSSSSGRRAGAKGQGNGVEDSDESAAKGSGEGSEPQATVPLVLDLPDGSRWGYRCSD